ncbi:methionyl-tRNA formyltransferase [Natrialbaceae archaeon A-CW1-1]
MRVVFITHNDLGLACLEELVDLGADVRSVFTRPQHEGVADQTDLSTFTTRHDIPLHEVESVNQPAITDRIAECDPQLLFVIGWSRLVDQQVLDLSSVASLGMHPAPLPRGRGRAPIAWNLIKGLERTQLSFFHLVEEADAGDLVGQEPIEIDLEDDAATLYAKVVDAGRELIQTYYPRFERGEVPRTPQSDERATWWPKRRPHHGLIEWTRPPMEVYNWIRGQSHPYPGAFSHLNDRRVTIWAAAPPTTERAFTRPGEIQYRDGDALGVGAWEGTIELTRVQVEGGDEQPAAALLERDDVTVGDRFENARDRLLE